MVHIQTGAGIDVTINDGAIGLYVHATGADIPLSDPKALAEVLTNAIREVEGVNIGRHRGSEK